MPLGTDAILSLSWSLLVWTHRYACLIICIFPPLSCVNLLSSSSPSWRSRSGREYRWLCIQVYYPASNWTLGPWGGRGMLEDLQFLWEHLKPCSDRASTSELTLALTLWNESGSHFEVSTLTSLLTLGVNGTCINQCSLSGTATKTRCEQTLRGLCSYYLFLSFVHTYH